MTVFHRWPLVRALALFPGILLAVSNGFAAYGLFCNEYASKAVAQLHEAVSLGMPNLVPPVWLDDYQGHRKWCLGMPEPVAQFQTALRQTAE